MKIVGAGLSKTGTMSLRHALNHLGYTTLHNDMERLNAIIEGTVSDPDFGVYDDIDAAVDLPTAFFFEELLAVYPSAKCILTVRDESAWWRSINVHFSEIFPLKCRKDDPLRWDIRSMAYGSADAREVLFRKRFRDHNKRVRSAVSPDRLLVLDITAGDGWDSICKFLGHDVPDIPFPHGNERKNLKHNAAALNLGEIRNH